MRVVARLWDRQFTGGIVEVDVTDEFQGYDMNNVAALQSLLVDVEKKYKGHLVDARVVAELPVMFYEI